MNVVVPVVSSALAGPAAARPAAGSVVRLRLPHGGLAGSASGLANRYRYRAAHGGARRLPIPSAAGGDAVGDAFVIESTTNVKFPREIAVPGCTEPLIILGTAPVVKSLSIILVRDVDGKTFVKALDDIITRQIKKPSTEEEHSLSTFEKAFLGRSLKQGTTVYLTWLEPSRLLISIAGNQDSSQVDAEITSATVNYALYDGFFGGTPVSPTLRSSTSQLLEAILTK